MVDLTILLTQIIDWGKSFAPKLVVALLTLVIGWWIIGIISRSFTKALKKSRVEHSLRKFLKSLLSALLKVLLLISVISMLGIAMTSFVAILAALGLAVGMALQGSLSNFAGGVLIILFKPFKVGDFISAQGHSGTVDEIQIFNTVLKTPDNVTIIIPNGGLSNGSVTNYSREPNRRVDFVFGIGYDDDIKKAKKILETLAAKDSRTLSKPAKPFIFVSELADSSVNLGMRVWVSKEDYWDYKFEMMELVKANFDKNKISIPYPQMDIHSKR